MQSGLDMPPITTFAVKTFGCKVNQYDSQLLDDGLSAVGLLPVATDEHADLVVVNTCA